MTWDAWLQERRIAVVATTTPDGHPHAVPVEVVVADGAVWVWCKRRSVKARNAARSGRAALIAYRGNDFVLVRGPVALVDEGDPAYGGIADAFLRKYERSETYGNDTLLRIEPEGITDRIGRPR